MNFQFFVDGIGLTGAESNQHGFNLTAGGGGSDERFTSFGELPFRFVQNFWLVLIRDFTNDGRIEEISLSINPGGQIPDFFEKIYDEYVAQIEAVFGSAVEQIDDGGAIMEGGLRGVRVIDDTIHVVMRLDLDEFSLKVSR